MNQINYILYARFYNLSHMVHMIWGFIILSICKNGLSWGNFPKAWVSISYPGNFRIRP